MISGAEDDSWVGRSRSQGLEKEDILLYNSGPDLPIREGFKELLPALLGPPYGNVPRRGGAKDVRLYL